MITAFSINWNRSIVVIIFQFQLRSYKLNYTNICNKLLVIIFTLMVWQLCFGHFFSDNFAQDCATKLARQEILTDWMKTKYQKNTMNSKIWKNIYGCPEPYRCADVFLLFLCCVRRSMSLLTKKLWFQIMIRIFFAN